MTEPYRDALWRAFSRTLLDFEESFVTEEVSCDYLAKYRWSDGRATPAAIKIMSGRSVMASFFNVRSAAIRRAWFLAHFSTAHASR